MSVWWIGVKDNKFRVFEATEPEAYSEEFERKFGIAFGQYRSREQAEADVKEHGAYLIKEAEKEVQRRIKGVKVPEISAKTVQKAKKDIQTLLKKGRTRQIVTETEGFSPGEEELALFFEALNELKLSIARVLDAGLALKRALAEVREENDKSNG